jgi:hypothetical protein
MSKDRYGYGTDVNKGDELRESLSKEFDLRRTFAEKAGLSPKYVPKVISQKEIDEWDNFGILPNSVTKQIGQWSKIQGLDEWDNLNKVMGTNTYQDEDWVNPY